MPETSGMLISRRRTSYLLPQSLSTASTASVAKSKLSTSLLLERMFAKAVRARGSSSMISTRIFLKTLPGGTPSPRFIALSGRSDWNGVTRSCSAGLPVENEQFASGWFTRVEHQDRQSEPGRGDLILPYREGEGGFA